MFLRWSGFILLGIFFVMYNELYLNLVKERYLIVILRWLGVSFVDREHCFKT